MKETKNVFMSELTEVFSKRQQQFVQFAYSYVRNREEAEDIVMGAFTNVWSTGMSYRRIPIFLRCC